MGKSELLFHDKVAVVTGGGMGIGKAIAAALATEGAHVAIFDINREAAAQAADEIRETGREVLVCEVDVSDADAVDSAVRKVLDRFDHIEILVNNAGTTHPSQSIFDLDLDWLYRITRVDFYGVYLCSRAIGKIMVDRQSGSVVNIASLAGLTSFPLPVYAPIKSAVIRLTQVLAREWAARNVRVNAIAPGHVLTPLIQDLFDRGMRDKGTICDNVPMHKLILPSEIADAVVYLCSDKARSITGITLPIDAGFLSEGAWKLFKM